MGAPRFVSSRLHFGSRVATLSIALSFVVMIVAVAVAEGFKEGIYSKLSEMGGDVAIKSLQPDGTMQKTSEICAGLQNIPGVEKAVPAIYSPGIFRMEDGIQGVMFKAVPMEGDVMDIMVPEELASRLSLEQDSKLTACFFNGGLKLRKLRVVSTYEGLYLDDDSHVVLCSEEMLRRVCGYGEDESTVIELSVSKEYRDSEASGQLMADIADYLYYGSGLTETENLYPLTLRARYAQLFSWLEVIWMNVDILLIIMTIVAGFNMVGGLLIMLFQNIGNIGILKTLGMNNRDISLSFLLAAAKSVFVAMLAGNALAIGLCLVQKYTHLIKLDPGNYFLNHVPIELDPLFIVAVDLVSFVAIMIMLLIPCAFISRIEPARSVEYR